MTTRKAVVLCTLTAIATFALTYTSPAPADSKDATLVYELRTYTCHPDKLANLNKRFSDHTLRIFEKHGMKNVAYWIPQDEKLKDNTLVYVIAHKSRAAADKSWGAFVKDPEWKKAYAASIADGKIVKKVSRQFLTPTDYSPIK
ncbi:MAG: NIPSNAP family protein [Planctomycetaceae bacterium]|nr:NIPSNAP family protein [Planctomycetaceae bacterium]